MSSLAPHYVSYDRFPAPKGAAVHIDAFVRQLSADWGTARLITVANPTPLETFVEPHIEHVAIPVRGRTVIDRVLSFRRALLATWPSAPVPLAHFRSIYEGYPLARQKRRFADRLVYEVNGLPSIELKYHYPHVADDKDLLHKLERQEAICLERADLILTVSDVNAAHLCRRGADPSRLAVIPNGVDVDLFGYQAPQPFSREPLLLYVGTLSPWQGVRLAIEALALYVRDFPARLRIVGSGRKRQRTGLLDLARRLEVADRVEVLEACSQSSLADHYRQADVVLAPLVANDRNLVQGCCPLKVLEAMAAGPPLISSDLPVVRALARHGQDALLVRPGSGKAIKDALLRLRDDRTLGRRLSASARRRVKKHFTWEISQRKLTEAYRRAGIVPASPQLSEN